MDQDTIHHLFPGLNKLLDFQRQFLIVLEGIHEQPWHLQRWGNAFTAKVSLLPLIRAPAFQIPSIYSRPTPVPRCPSPDRLLCWSRLGDSHALPLSHSFVACYPGIDFVANDLLFSLPLSPSIPMGPHRRKSLQFTSHTAQTTPMLPNYSRWRSKTLWCVPSPNTIAFPSPRIPPFTGPSPQLRRSFVCCLPFTPLGD